jgi:hypothetical protein
MATTPSEDNPSEYLIKVVEDGRKTIFTKTYESQPSFQTLAEDLQETLG